MSTWNNLDTLESFKELSNVKKVNLVEAMTGENGAERVKKKNTAYRWLLVLHITMLQNR